jgi:methylase of polypeptide subunit release factors
MSLANLNKVEQAALCPNTSIRDVEFLRADILSTNISSPVPLLRDVLHNRGQTRWDILISNPPYISPEQFNSVTARSVRNFEPKVALVPDADHSYLSDHEHGDLFYPQLLKIARELNVKVLLMEVGDLEQAKRVAGRAQVEGRWDGVEIWRDVPAAADEDESSWDYIGIRGQGNGRSVVCWTLSAQKWIGKHQ